MPSPGARGQTEVPDGKRSERKGKGKDMDQDCDTQEAARKNGSESTSDSEGEEEATTTKAKLGSRGKFFAFFFSSIIRSGVRISIRTINDTIQDVKRTLHHVGGLRADEGVRGNEIPRRKPMIEGRKMIAVKLGWNAATMMLRVKITSTKTPGMLPITEVGLVCE